MGPRKIQLLGENPKSESDQPGPPPLPTRLSSEPQLTAKGQHRVHDIGTVWSRKTRRRDAVTHSSHASRSPAREPHQPPQPTRAVRHVDQAPPSLTAIRPLPPCPATVCLLPHCRCASAAGGDFPVSDAVFVRRRRSVTGDLPADSLVTSRLTRQ
ncbi:hypothetical protein Rs2_38606 [Raphanus sativus]|nr:hypothetical protein Rs2_38606 [Raphanus sativus]